MRLSWKLLPILLVSQLERSWRIVFGGPGIRWTIHSSCKNAIKWSQITHHWLCNLTLDNISAGSYLPDTNLHWRRSSELFVDYLPGRSEMSTSSESVVELLVRLKKLLVLCNEFDGKAASKKFISPALQRTYRNLSMLRFFHLQWCGTIELEWKLYTKCIKPIFHVCNSSQVLHFWRQIFWIATLLKTMFLVWQSHEKLNIGSLSRT